VAPKTVGCKTFLPVLMKLDETLYTAGVREGVFLVVALVDEADLHAVVQEAELAQLLGDDVVVEIDVRENRKVGREVRLRDAQFGLADDLHRRDFDAVPFAHRRVARSNGLAGCLA